MNKYLNIMKKFNPLSIRKKIENKLREEKSLGQKKNFKISTK